MSVLVTGGCGFIGSHLVQKLVEAGHHVRVFDNLSSGRREALGPASGEVELVVGDLRDPEALARATQGIEIVYHLAALVSVTQTVEQPLLAYAANLTGSVNLLDAARQAGARRVVQASTCAVYGNSKQLPASERDTPQPLSPYAATKLAAEQAGQVYSRLYGLETTTLRFFNVYGPRQDPASPYAAVVPRFITAYLAGTQPTIYGDGGQTRDFVYVGDIVAALLAVAQAPKAAGGVFNVGRGEECSVLQLAQIIAGQLGVEAVPRFVPAREGEVRRSWADVTALTQATGFHAQTDLHSGLARTIETFRKPNAPDPLVA